MSNQFPLQPERISDLQPLQSDCQKLLHVQTAAATAFAIFFESQSALFFLTGAFVSRRTGDDFGGKRARPGAICQEAGADPWREAC